MKGLFSAASLRRFARDSEGATMIEFGLVFPMMLLITMGIMETSLYMAGVSTLEGGLREASRYGITSQSPTEAAPPDLSKVPVPFKKDPKDYRMQQIGLILRRHTLNLINLDDADVSTKTYDNFALKDGEPFTDLNNNGKYDGPGTPGVPAAGEPYQDIACPAGNGVWDGPKSTGNGVGSPGAIVVYTITYNWRFFTPLIGKILGRPDPDPKNAGQYILPLSVTMVVKNEPTLSGSTFAC
jgi:Flp pilus assembly pilin Flp